MHFVTNPNPTKSYQCVKHETLYNNSGRVMQGVPDSVRNGRPTDIQPGCNLLLVVRHYYQLCSMGLIIS